MAVGASGITASLVSYFVDRANRDIGNNQIIDNYNNETITIYCDLWEFFSDKAHSFIIQIEDIKPQKKLYIGNISNLAVQLSTTVSEIDMFSSHYSHLIDADLQKFYTTLRGQLVSFIASLENPYNSDHLAISLNDMRTWLKNRYSDNKIFKLLFMGVLPNSEVSSIELKRINVFFSAFGSLITCAFSIAQFLFKKQVLFYIFSLGLVLLILIVTYYFSCSREIKGSSGFWYFLKEYADSVGMLNPIVLVISIYLTITPNIIIAIICAIFGLVQVCIFFKRLIHHCKNKSSI